MKIKQKSTLAFTLIILTVFGSSVFALFDPGASTASALTQQQCINRYNGKTLDTEAKNTAYFKSKCDVSDNGPCRLGPSEASPLYSMAICEKKTTTPTKKLTKQQCIAKYHSKLEPTQKDSDSMKAEGCGTYCQIRAVAPATVIDCKEEYKEYENESSESLNSDEDTKPCDVETAIIKLDCSKGNVDGKGAIWAILLLIIGIMTAGVGLLAIGGVIYAAILYATAADKAAQVTKAKETIFNVVLGLVMFALMWSFLQFLIPGGVFS